MNHRLVQRTLFRMQLDPGFAARLQTGAPEEADGLGAAELRLLRGADPRALAADRDGKRRRQFLANVSSEFGLSVAGGLDVEGFTTSVEFHEAVRADASLPVAFARYAGRCSHAEPAPLRALIALECALSRARREDRVTPKLRPGELALAATATLVDVPGGTLALAANQRAALDAGMALPILLLPPAVDETLLVRATPAASAFRLRDVAVEHVSPALASLLRETRRPCSRATLGAKLAIAPDDLKEILDELVADGVLDEVR
jgi:hypothetical protein